MTEGQVSEFLSKANIARLATINPDGSPFNVPVWYEWNASTRALFVIGRKRSGWIENIKREPRVCVLIDRSEPPTPKVLIQGSAKIVGSDPKEWIPIAKKMSARYLGDETGSSYFEGSIDQPRILLEIRASSLTSWINPPDEELRKRPRLDWPTKYYEPGSKWYNEYHAEKATRKMKDS
ncbi:MAG: pyridoxamine 5'-phosphate oxidase family protein [Thaumarchaeota archaeon]|nr:pyridoxamine 5'-phosphate oxidase family protein [Nitrososphaerota archaeon]